MDSYNLNEDVIIYPNISGWIKINELISQKYNISIADGRKMVGGKKTKDGGYKDQMWVIIHDLHEMFYNGQSYFKTMNIKLAGI